MEIPIHQSTELQDLIKNIKHGADVMLVRHVLESQLITKTEKNMRSLAKAAVEAGDKDIIIILLAHGLNLNAAFDIVVNSNKEDLIKLMVDRGADVNEGLYLAVKANKKNAIAILIERGANINTIKRNGYTPLHTALMQKICDLEVVEFLINSGADTRVPTRSNKTVLDLFNKLNKKKYDEETKQKLKNISLLLSDDLKSNTFECTMGMPTILSGYSYQSKILTLYVIKHTKQAISCSCQYELSTNVKNLLPFDDVYLRKTQEGHTSCEFIQVNQTEEPEFKKISASKFFTMPKRKSDIRDVMKGNNLIVKKFFKFNEIHESFLEMNSSGTFIHCENTTFHNDPSPYFIRVNGVPNSSVLCGIKHDKWTVDKKMLVIEIKYILLKLIISSPYFLTMDEDIQTIFKNQIQLLIKKTCNKKENLNINEETLSFMKIARKGLEASYNYETHLYYCKRNIEDAIDVETVKNYLLQHDFEIVYTDDLTLLKLRSIHKISEVLRSFKIDKEFFSFFSKYDDSEIGEKIANFVNHFSIYTNCPNSDQLDAVIKKEISEEFKISFSSFIASSFQLHVNDWISSFKRGKGNIFTDKDGKKFFFEMKKRIFEDFNQSYIEELEKGNINFKHFNLQIMNFLNFENNYKILHVITPNTHLHTIHILQAVNTEYLHRYNNVLCTNLVNILKSYDNLKNLLDAFTLNESNDLLILECPDNLNSHKISIILNHMENINKMNSIKKIIIIANNDNKLAIQLKLIEKQYTSCNYCIAFKNLTEKSQEFILNKIVNFSNNPKAIQTHFKINDFISNTAANDVIDEEMLSTIITNIDKVKIGNENTFISDKYNVEYFIPRYLQNIDISIFKKCTKYLFFLTGITKNELTKKISFQEQYIYIWTENVNYDKGIILMPERNVTAYKEYEEIFRRLSCKVQNCYWLEFKGDLLYKKDTGLNHDKNFEKILKSHKLYLENLEDRIVILANDAGEGKSTMLTHLAHRMRSNSGKMNKIHIESWIIRIDLKNYTDDTLPVSLKHITFCVDETTKAIDLITRMVIQVNTANVDANLEIKLLKAALNGCGKIGVILLFDGFDEISPVYKEKTCILLKALASSNVRQLWVTTRGHLKEYLEKELYVSARMLASFSTTELTQFLCKYWKWHLKNIKCTNDVSEKDNVLEIVNQLRLLFRNFKGFGPHNYKILEKFNLLEIHKFIDYEIDLVRLAKTSLDLWEKSKTNYDFLKIPLHIEMFAKNVIQREWQLLSFKNSLLVGIYTDFVENKLNIHFRNVNLTSNLHYKEQIDLVVLPIKQMHREIAIRNLFESSSRVLPEFNICSKTPNFIEKLTRVGLVKSYGTWVMFVHRTFAEYYLGDYLVTHLEDPVVQSECLIKILLYDEYYRVRVFFDGFLLQHVQQYGKNQEKEFIEDKIYPFTNIISHNISKEMLNQIREDGENVLHIAIRECHMQIYLLILNNISNSSLMELIMTKSREGCSMLQLCINTEHNDMFNIIVDSINELPYYSQFTTGQNSSISYNSEIKFNQYEHTALHCSTDKEQSYAIYTPHTCSILEQLMKEIDLDNRNALHYAAISHNKNISTIILNCIEENSDLLKKLIIQVDNNGQTVLHLAAMSGRIDVCDKIIKISEKHEGLYKELILLCDVYERTALHLAVVFKRRDICELIIKTSVKDTDLLKELIIKRNYKNETILHSAIRNSDKIICSLILRSIKKYEDLHTNLLIQQDHNDQTILHIATLSREVELCELILKHAKKCKLLLKIVIMQRNNKKHTALQIAVLSNCEEICYLILKNAVKHEDIFRDIIMQCNDDHEWTALHLAANNGYSAVCRVILDTAKVHNKVLKILITQGDMNKKTALELAMQNGHKDFCCMFIATVLQSHYALRIWLNKMISKFKIIYSRNRFKKCKKTYRSEVTAVAAAVLQTKYKIYDYIAKTNSKCNVFSGRYNSVNLNRSLIPRINI